MVVTGPLIFEKNLGPLFRKIVLPDVCGPQLPSKQFYCTFKHLQADRRLVKTIPMVSGSESTHRVVTSPVNSKQPGRFFREIMIPEICGP